MLVDRVAFRNERAILISFAVVLTPIDVIDLALPSGTFLCARIKLGILQRQPLIAAWGHSTAGLASLQCATTTPEGDNNRGA
jgi:hypothetical protein